MSYSNDPYARRRLIDAMQARLDPCGNLGRPAACAVEGAVSPRAIQK